MGLTWRRSRKSENTWGRCEMEITWTDLLQKYGSDKGIFEAYFDGTMTASEEVAVGVRSGPEKMLAHSIERLRKTLDAGGRLGTV